MSQRDDFSQKTKRALAERVAFCCSFPGCGQVTVGPSDKDANSTSNIGMACHISAAAGGAGSKRYDKNLTAEERGSVENGIWMCYTHGKLIDTDEARFSQDKLKAWKRIAELKAQAALDAANASLLANTSLATDTVLLSSSGHENQAIGEAISDSLLAEVWGFEIAQIIRDVCIEIARNALTHGGAKSVTLKIEDYCVRLADDGLEHNPWLIADAVKKQGGARTINHLQSRFGHQLFLEYVRQDGENRIAIAIVSNKERLSSLTPCCVTVDLAKLHEWKVAINVPQECRTLHLLMPDFITLSDIFVLKRVLSAMKEERPLVFMVSKTSQFTQEIIKEVFPNSRIIDSI